jgi:hypothetical protein
MGRTLFRVSLAIISLFVLARAASAQTSAGVGLYGGPPPYGTPQPAPGPDCQPTPMPCGFVDGGLYVPGGSPPPQYVPAPAPPVYVEPAPAYSYQGGGQTSGGSVYYYSQSSGGGDRYGPPQPGPGCDPCQQQGGGYVQGYVTGYRDGYRDGYGDAIYGGGYTQQSYDRRWNPGCGCYAPPAPCQSTPRYDCRTGEVSLNDSFFYDGGGVGPAGLAFGGGGGGGYASAGSSASASAYASSSVSIRYGGGGRRGGGWKPPRGGGCGCRK